MEALQRCHVHGESVEAQAEAEHRHHKGRGHDVPAVEVSSRHVTTLAAARDGVSPFSDVIVPRVLEAPGARARLAVVDDGIALDRRRCDRARVARDPRFDGWFFTGVLTTRIYCRPVCPVKPARSRNVVFYPTAAAAERAGFRPCLRCRPEAAPGTPAWRGAAATVSRALRLIARGFLDDGQGVEDLASTLG